MTDLELHDITQFRDLVGIWYYDLEREVLASPPEQALAYAARVTRDRNRTPLQWSPAPNAGFSPAGVQTWLPVNPNFASGVNVAEQAVEPDSLLNFYRRILRVRRQTPALIDGDYQVLAPMSETYLIFLRRSTTTRQTCLVALNMSGQAIQVSDLDQNALGHTARRVFSSHERVGTTDDLSTLSLAPFEIYISELDI